MAEKSENTRSTGLQQNEMRPQAPKDPKAQRGKVYLMLDSLIEGKPEQSGYADLYFLGGRVEAKLLSVLPDLDREIAAKLQSCAGFSALVEEVGVSILGTEENWREQTAAFTLSGAGGAFCLSADIPCTGQEVRIPVPEAAGEGILEVAATRFSIYMMAKMTITLYMKPGITVPELKAEDEIDFTSAQYQAMLDASVICEGDLTRLREAAAKAMRGEEVTVAFIGGSITQGAAAKPIGTRCYAYLAYKAFCSRFAGGIPESETQVLSPTVRFVKAGVGGTSSEFGVCRYERDVLREGTVTPDVLVIEFAVNDMGDETEGEAFESLIAKAQEGPGNPAVIIMFSVFMDDWNLEERLVPIGKLYNLPMVSVKRAVVDQFYQEKPVITKRQYFYDLYHPTNEGHQVMADCLDRIFALAHGQPGCSQADTAAGKAPALPEEVLARPSRWLKGVRTYSRNQISSCPAIKDFAPGGFTGTDNVLQCVQKDELAGAFPEFEDNWMFTGGEPMRFTVSAKDILLIYKDDSSERFGKAAVFVDGKPAREIDPREIGWVHCNALIVLRGEEVKEHQVEIRVEEGKTFTLLGISFT